MADEYLRIENFLPFAIHLRVEVNPDEKELKVRLTRQPREDTLEIPPTRSAEYPVDGPVRLCFRGTKLAYEIDNALGIDIQHEYGRLADDGIPTFRFKPVLVN